jgi:hypothetical protein
MSRQNAPRRETFHRVFLIAAPITVSLTVIGMLILVANRVAMAMTTDVPGAVFVHLDDPSLRFLVDGLAVLTCGLVVLCWLEASARGRRWPALILAGLGSFLLVLQMFFSHLYYIHYDTPRSTIMVFVCFLFSLIIGLMPKGLDVAFDHYALARTTPVPDGPVDVTPGVTDDQLR